MKLTTPCQQSWKDKLMTMFSSGKSPHSEPTAFSMISSETDSFNSPKRMNSSSQSSIDHGERDSTTWWTLKTSALSKMDNPSKHQVFTPTRMESKQRKTWPPKRPLRTERQLKKLLRTTLFQAAPERSSRPSRTEKKLKPKSTNWKRENNCQSNLLIDYNSGQWKWSSLISFYLFT